MTDMNTEKYLIADWAFQAADSSIENGSERHKLEPLLSDFLLYLVQHPGRVISRDELLETVWHGRVVSDDAIRRVVKKLRVALGDDAKNPRYIKTNPLKGYSFVAPVKVAAKAKNRSLNSRLVAVAILITTALGLVFYFVAQANLVKPTQAIQSEQALTHLSGSEMQADYHPESQRLLFISRSKNNDSLQLYMKDMKKQLVHRLSWGPDSFYSPRFAPNGRQVAYVRQVENKESQQIFIADLHPQKGLINSRAIKISSQNNRLSNWSADGQSLYIFSGHEHEGPWDIYRFHIATQQIEQITYSGQQGHGAFYAKESADGQYLAILKNLSGRRYAMVVLRLSDASIVAERSLSFFADNIVWLNKGQRSQAADGSLADLALSSFKGDLYYFSLGTDKLWPQQGTKPGLNDIFYSCGPECFYMRRHTMNYTDVLEIPNPFGKVELQATWHLESSSAEFNPIYNLSGDGVFYTIKDQNNAYIVRHILGQAAQQLYRFNPRFITRELVLSPDGKYLSGRLEDRMFLLDIEAKKFTYLSSELEMLGPPSWSRDSQALFFSRRHEDASVLYRVEIENKAISFVESDNAYLRQQADGREFVVDNKLNLYPVVAGQRQAKINQFQHLATQNWQVQGEYLYYSQFQGQSSYLVRKHLPSGKTEIRLLDKNTGNWEFALHPVGDRLIIQRYQTAASDLVKVQWHSNKDLKPTKSD